MCGRANRNGCRQAKLKASPTAWPTGPIQSLSSAAIIA